MLAAGAELPPLPLPDPLPAAGAGARTVTAQEASTPSTEAVTVALPSATAVTVPSPSTVATASSEEVHTTPASSASSGSAVRVRDSVLPVLRVRASSDRCSAFSAGFTTTWQVAARPLPGISAVTRASPAATGVTVPAASTVTMLSSEER